MPKDKQKPPSETSQASGVKAWSFGLTAKGALPYLIAAILTSGVMAWYFFIFVPSQLDYFVGSRFRSLAVASGHVRSKIENLQKAMDGATKNVASKDVDPYLSVVVPDAQTGTEAPVQDLHLVTSDKNVTGSIAWRDIMVQAAAASTRDFDDLVLSDGTGAVVWQRERTTPRIGNLNELLNAESEQVRWLPVSISWGVHTTTPKKEEKLLLPETALLKPVNLNGQSSFLMIQAISLPKAGHTAPDYYVAGLVSQDALRREAMHIPILWVVLVSLPVVLLFLALPFIKLATLTPKERYRFADVVLLAVAGIIAAGIGTILAFTPTFVGDSTDKYLFDFADRLEANFARETKTILDLAEIVRDRKSDISKELGKCKVGFPKAATDFRCGFWETLSSLQKKDRGGWGKVESGSLELDVLIWLDSDGNETDKWTAKQQVTFPVPHRSFEHFRDIKANHVWSVNGEKRTFAFQRLPSPTTSEAGFIFAIPTGSGTSVALNVRPQTLVDPVVPPGYGFAVLDGTGRVLFHSEDGLSLQENFFEEVGSREDVREEAMADRAYTWTGEYHGRRHRLFIRPMNKEFVDCPFRIVTFQEMEPVFAASVAEETDILRLGFINSGFLVLFGLILWWWSTMKNREVRDCVMAVFSIHARDSRASKNSIVYLSVLAVIGVLLIASTYMPETQQQLDRLYLFFVILPLLSIVGVILTRIQTLKKSASPSHSEASRFRPNARWLAFELAMLILLIGAFPAAGFTRIVYRFDRVQQTEQWLRSAEQRWSERRTRVRDRAQGPNYSDKTQGLLQQTAGFAADVPPDTARYSYLNLRFSGLVPDDDSADFADYRTRGQSLLRTLLGWSISSSNDESSGPDKVTLSRRGTIRLEPKSGIPARLEVPYSEEDVSGKNMALGLGILAAVLAAVYSASQKLIPAPMVRPPLLQEEDVLAVQAAKYEGIILIGAPRMAKDGAIEKAVSNVTQKPIHRIPLLDAELSKSFIETKLQEVRNLPTTGKDGYVDSQRCIWVLVSNLESQLVTAESRMLVLQLLEKLFEATTDEPRRVVIVSSTVDPIAHFEEIFEHERERIYKDPIPEVELSRSSLVLSRFRRRYLPLFCPEKHEPPVWENWLRYNPSKWPHTAHIELKAYTPLLGLGAEIRSAWYETKVPLEILARTVKNKAHVYYELLWTSCTRSEKLVLIQLAQEGFVNPKSRETMTQLVAKGLITEHGAIFNYTFRGFLRGIERSHVVHAWESMEGSGLWVVAGRLIASSMVAGGVFYLLTQDFSVQSLLPIISGTGVFGVPIVRNLLARVSGKPASVDTA